jgi:hypothetical protein
MQQAQLSREIPSLNYSSSEALDYDFSGPSDI